MFEAVPFDEVLIDAVGIAAQLDLILNLGAMKFAGRPSFGWRRTGCTGAAGGRGGGVSVAGISAFSGSEPEATLGAFAGGLSPSRP